MIHDTPFNELVKVFRCHRRQTGYSLTHWSSGWLRYSRKDCSVKQSASIKYKYRYTGIYQRFTLAITPFLWLNSRVLFHKLVSH